MAPEKGADKGGQPAQAGGPGGHQSFTCSGIRALTQVLVQSRVSTLENTGQSRHKGEDELFQLPLEYNASVDEQFDACWNGEAAVPVLLAEDSVTAMAAGVRAGELCKCLRVRFYSKRIDHSITHLFEEWAIVWSPVRTVDDNAEPPSGGQVSAQAYRDILQMHRVTWATLRALPGHSLVSKLQAMIDDDQLPAQEVSYEICGGLSVKGGFETEVNERTVSSTVLGSFKVTLHVSYSKPDTAIFASKRPCDETATFEAMGSPRTSWVLPIVKAEGTANTPTHWVAIKQAMSLEKTLGFSFGWLGLVSDAIGSPFQQEPTTSLTDGDDVNVKEEECAAALFAPRVLPMSHKREVEQFLDVLSHAEDPTCPPTASVTVDERLEQFAQYAASFQQHPR
mmetsp:Transcript_13529/g.53634  ORF Transcript_13529/g.53634 Transcript_13529/m.53634 type:complete len:395 (-) Transcript_13529:75-1259(-)